MKFHYIEVKRQTNDCLIVPGDTFVTWKKKAATKQTIWQAYNYCVTFEVAELFLTYQL